MNCIIKSLGIQIKINRLRAKVKTTLSQLWSHYKEALNLTQRTNKDWIGQPQTAKGDVMACQKR